MYAIETTPALKCRIENEKDQLFYLNKTGDFVPIETSLKLICAANNTVVSFARDGKTVVTVSATEESRFSVAFAVFSNGAWRFRALVLKTTDTGAMTFPLHKSVPHVDGKYEVPAELPLTLLVLGIHSVEAQSGVKVMGITDGRKYFCGFTYHRISDETSVTNIPRAQKVSVHPS